MSDYYDLLPSQYKCRDLDEEGFSRLAYPIARAPRTPAMPVSLARQELKALERINRTNVLRDVLDAEEDLAKQWLNCRYPGEDGIRIDFTAESRERRFLFPRGEDLRATLDIHIR